MMVIDDIVYIGSANLDPRSLAINYEIMLRIRCPVLAHEAVATFERDLAQSELVPRQTWRKPSGWWRQVKERAARLIFTRLDLGLAQMLAHKGERPGRATAAGKQARATSHLSAAPENRG
jgi:cardiolipin synthase